VVDRAAGTKSADLDIGAEGVSSLDWASVSQGGGYVLLHGVINGAAQTTKVYDRATLALRSFWSTDPLGHFDLGVDAAGREVAFGAASGGTYSRRFVARRLDTGQITPLSAAISFNWHASTRAVQRPGWGYAVTNDLTGAVLDGELYALKLDGSQGIERYGRHRTVGSGTASAVAVPSPDGRRVMFGSNWGGTAVQTYIVDTRNLCP